MKKGEVEPIREKCFPHFAIRQYKTLFVGPHVPKHLIMTLEAPCHGLKINF